MSRSIACAFGVFILSLAGCNMPTPPDHIPVPWVSTVPYEHLDCVHLTAEQNHLNNVEQELVIAQEKRSSTSGGHAVFYGWGRGDGMETVELAKIRGIRDAIRRTQAQKGCSSR